MEYGTARIPHDKREYGFFDQVVTWFGSGVNTGSWYFGGMAAAIGMSFVWQYAFIYLPLMMIPWAMIGWISMETWGFYCDLHSSRPGRSWITLGRHW